MADTKRCAFCAEEIRAEAVRCPHCRSRLGSFELDRWHRGHEDARLAGVASAVAHALSLPVGAVRLGFVLLSLVHLIGALAYGALWLIVPPRLGESSVSSNWSRGRPSGRAGSPAAAPLPRLPAGAASGSGVSSGGVSGLASSVISGGDGER